MVKTTINSEPVEWNYPCLAVGPDGEVVLFEKERCGTVLKQGREKTSRAVGCTPTLWIMEYFTPFTGSITLSNE